MAFFVGEIELRQNLIFTQEKLEQKNEELKEEEKKLEIALETELEKDEALREQQDQLSIALAAAQQANKAKTMFLNSMSHDIRTPMNAIKFTPVGGDIIIHLVEKPCQTKGYTTYEFSIKDTGTGMSSEFVGHVFDTFAREQSATVSGIQETDTGSFQKRRQGRNRSSQFGQKNNRRNVPDDQLCNSGKYFTWVVNGLP